MDFNVLNEKMLELENKNVELEKLLKISKDEFNKQIEQLSKEIESNEHYVKSYCVQIKLNNF
jgi:hypothetical protein